MCIKSTPSGWNSFCLPSCLVLINILSLPVTISHFLLPWRNPKLLNLVHGIWTKDNYWSLIPLRGADVSIN